MRQKLKKILKTLLFFSFFNHICNFCQALCFPVVFFSRPFSITDASHARAKRALFLRLVTPA